METSSFPRRGKAPPAPQEQSTADALGVKPPALSRAQRAGFAVAAAVEQQRYEAGVAAYERMQAQKRAFEDRRDAEVLRRVAARQAAAIG
jgi:hypothetical protein